ncbi:hypothetical protein EOM81_10695 [bacterium]|nr:hypothetical protein [bacterium]
MEKKPTIVAVVNQQQIQIIKRDNQEFVPIKPICSALGIDPWGQQKRIKKDILLGSVTDTVAATGSDGKNYEMVVLPLRYVFGWLFTIDSNLVKEESREAVLKYQMECYDALYDYFKSYLDFVTYKQKLIDEALELYDQARTEFSGAKNKVKEARELLDQKRAISYQAYLQENRQLTIDFDNIEN